MTVVVPIAPRVPIILPGEEETSWIDVREKLNRNRILFLCQEIEAEISNDLMGLMLYLSMENSTQDLYLFINSPGGDIIHGMAIHNIMRFIPYDINTICLGLAASIASYVLVGGEYKKRIALPHARIMIHQPACYWVEVEDEDDDDKDDEDKIDKIQKMGHIDSYNECKSIMSIRETIARVYSERTGKPLWIISQDLERDFYMSAIEAKAYGIVDCIKEKSKKQNI
uniref:ATP-dependent Clp protease proteolytic subunit n=1 Tax=Rhipsalis teres TaxID=169218 RepID=A0A894JPG4_9CARY|nr:clp protease proteolytic subunit [Rhipsalis teres]QRV60075.1 clp protease proteolytic subunit [Rhipsalis teres]